MRFPKQLFTLLFALTFQHAFSQERFDITISLDSSLDSKNISCSYDNGRNKVFVKDTFVNNTCRLKGEYFSKLVAFQVDYNHGGRYFSSSFFIKNKPAKIHFIDSDTLTSLLKYDTIKNATAIMDTATDKTWRDLFLFREKQAGALSDLWQKHGNEIGKNDSITLLNRQLFKALNDRTILFLQKYPNDYYSFWIFREHIVSPSLVFIKDTSYFRSLLDSFKSIFPAVYTESFEGQQVIKKLEGLIKAKEASQIAFPFSLKDNSGKIVKSSDFKGKYILLDFWASWCGPCRANNPVLKRINDKYHNSKFELISISADENSNNWKAAIKKDSMNWTNLLDLKGRNSKILDAYGIAAYPTYILINPSGKVILRTENEIAKIQEKIEDIF